MRRRTLLGAGAAAIAATAGPGCTGRRAAEDPPGGEFLLHNVRIFDGERIADANSLHVEAGLIEALGTDLPTPDGVASYDGGGATVLPGLIDGHVHVLDLSNDRADALRFGVTTVLDMFTSPSWLAEARAARVSTQPTDRADTWSAGILVTAPEGHGTQFGFEIPTLAPGDDAEAFVNDRLAEGSDYIKLVMGDGSLVPDWSPPTLSDEQVREVIDAAHQNDVLAVVHVSTVADAVTAAEAGANALVHIPHDQQFNDSQLDRLRNAGVPVVATLAIVSSLSCGPHAAALRDDPRVAPLLRGPQAGNLSQTFGQCSPDLLDHGLANVGLLHAAAVPMLAGTDAPNPGATFGASMLTELGLLVEAGLTPAETLTAATAATADQFGLTDPRPDRTGNAR